MFWKLLLSIKPDSFFPLATFFAGLLFLENLGCYLKKIQQLLSGYCILLELSSWFVHVCVLSGLFIWVCFGWIVLFPRFCLKMDHPSSLFFGTFQTLQHIALWFLAVKTIIQWKDPFFISWVAFYNFAFSLSMSSFYNI